MGFDKQQIGAAMTHLGSDKQQVSLFSSCCDNTVGGVGSYRWQWQLLRCIEPKEHTCTCSKDNKYLLVLCSMQSRIKVIQNKSSIYMSSHYTCSMWYGVANIYMNAGTILYTILFYPLYLTDISAGRSSMCSTATGYNWSGMGECSARCPHVYVRPNKSKKITALYTVQCET